MIHENIKFKTIENMKAGETGWFISLDGKVVEITLIGYRDGLQTCRETGKSCRLIPRQPDERGYHVKYKDGREGVYEQSLLFDTKMDALKAKENDATYTLKRAIAEFRKIRDEIRLQEAK